MRFFVPLGKARSTRGMRARARILDQCRGIGCSGDELCGGQLGSALFFTNLIYDFVLVGRESRGGEWRADNHNEKKIKLEK